MQSKPWQPNNDKNSGPAICFEELTWIKGEKLYNQRRIVCAANKFWLVDGKEIIIPCIRHGSPDMHNTLDLLDKEGLLESTKFGADDQGFVDQYGNWWSREDAFIIATAANQVNIERNGSTDELYSEGLY